MNVSKFAFGLVALLIGVTGGIALDEGVQPVVADAVSGMLFALWFTIARVKERE